MKPTKRFGVSSHAVSWGDWPFAGEVFNGLDHRETVNAGDEGVFGSVTIVSDREWFSSHILKARHGGPRPDPLDLPWSTLAPPPEGDKS